MRYPKIVNTVTDASTKQPTRHDKTQLITVGENSMAFKQMLS